MRAKIIKWGLSITLIVGITVLFFQYSHKPVPERFPLAQAPSQTIIAAPTRLMIAAISVDAAIEQVALATDGSMDVPKLPMSTAWYKLGPQPGEIGSAVIAGHVNWKNSSTAVFSNLYKLKPGDRVQVQSSEGEMTTFIVRESRTYESDADATNIFTSSDGLAHLNLITCTGSWEKAVQSYSQRLVVFTDREP